MDEFLPVVGIVGILGFAGLMVAMISWHLSRSRTVLEQWADENGYEILYSEYRHFFKGPFWMSSNGQTVYHVTVKMDYGEIRTGWVRCGGWVLGLLTDKAEVRWEY